VLEPGEVRMQKEAKDSSPAGKSSATKSRSERRREDTRRRLMKATYEIIARRGLEGLVIQDITEAADVGYGSFYNHFSSKEAVVEAVIDAALARNAALYEKLNTVAADGVEKFAFELRSCLEQSRNDTVWGWFVIRTILSGTQSRLVVADRLKRSIEGGMRAGVFVADDAEMARHVIGGLLLLGTLKIVNGEAGGDYAERLAETALKSLGVPREKISSVLAKPLPDMAMPPFLEAA
jgi:AcrR family transcriptional regulator